MAISLRRLGIGGSVSGYADGAFEAIPFTVGGPPEVDNGRMTVHIEWGNPETDWDLYVINAATGEVVTQSASFGDTTEDAGWALVVAHMAHPGAPPPRAGRGA
jgi:hypothetical protein